MPLPEDHVKGLGAQKADFDHDWDCFLPGEWKSGGWWHYLYALWVKTPIGMLSLIVVACIVSQHSQCQSFGD
jgi:hypothetical protein